MQNREYQQILEIAESQRLSYLGKKARWKGSPFAWIVNGGVTSRQKGKIGEEIVKKFLQLQDFKVSGSVGTDSDMTVNGHRVEVKFSTLWETDIYKFQQIRDQQYDILFCVGISPHVAHAWVVQKSDIIWKDMAHQHLGSKGTDTWWISFEPPICPYEWMRPQNGDLSKVCEELKKIIT